jgi:integrase
MSALRQALANYLALRRALGYRLVRSEKLLNQFIDHLEASGDSTITVRCALSWARLPTNVGMNWWAHRLSAVRGFAAHLHAIDPRTEVPPKDLLPSRPGRANPYLYSEEEIDALLSTTASLKTPLRQVTFKTLIGLLAVTGMRIGEAIRLNLDDVDFTSGSLLVLCSKYGKSRELMLHPTTLRALADYVRLRRDQRHSGADNLAMFTSSSGTRLLYCNVHWTFQRLLHQVGSTARSHACRPRIHDLRHSFAVPMLDAYTRGEDGQKTLTLLSTYLGHANPAGTYWYLSASPELLAAAGQRLELYLGGPR